MIINVTKDDIEKGIPKNAVFCPVALALHRVFPDADVSVSGTLIIVNNSGKLNLLYSISNDVHYFITNFDKGKHVEPFSFEFPSEQNF
jgi:hypothetical protein